jgi:hypothetical protein
MTVIDNPDREIMFLLQVVHRLELEIKVPGLRFKGRKTTMGFLNERYGKLFRKKQVALEFAHQKLDEVIEQRRQEAITRESV